MNRIASNQKPKDDSSREARSLLMSKVKSKNTRPELFVRRILIKLGFRYRLHYKNLPGTPDIVFPKMQKAIFVHGCFWHRHSNCKYSTTPKTRMEFWNEKFEKNIERDKRKLRELEKLGWKIKIVWQCELKDENKLSENLTTFLS